MPAPLLLNLAAHKRRQAEARLKLGSAWQAFDFVFCSEEGAPLSIPNITYRYFRSILTKAKLPRIRPYDLCHMRDAAIDSGGKPESGQRTARTLDHRSDTRHLQSRAANDAARSYGATRKTALQQQTCCYIVFSATTSVEVCYSKLVFFHSRRRKLWQSGPPNRTPLRSSR